VGKEDMVQISEVKGTSLCIRDLIKELHGRTAWQLIPTSKVLDCVKMAQQTKLQQASSVNNKLVRYL
jgi:hypothetical protein